MALLGPNAVDDSPCQTVPATPLLYQRLCRSPTAEVPASQLMSTNDDSSPSLLFEPSFHAGGTPGQTGMTNEAHAAVKMENGERILFVLDTPVTPQSTGTPRAQNTMAQVEQIVPATPVRNSSTKRVSSLLTSSLSSRPPKRRTVRLTVAARWDPGQSRARGLKQRSLLPMNYPDPKRPEHEYHGLFAAEDMNLFTGSDEDIFPR